MNVLSRSFDPLHGVSPSVKEDFVIWHRQAKLLQIRYVAFLTALLYLVYAAIEQSVLTEQRDLRLYAHGLVLPASLLTIGIMSYKSILRRLMIWLLILASIGAVTVSLYFNSRLDDFAYYAPEVYLNLMWTFAISGLSLRQATLTASASVLITLAFTLSSSLLPGAQRLNLLWIMAAYSFGFLSAFLLEKAHKSMFLHQSRLTLAASLDGLTGLWNRTRIDQFFAEEIARANRYDAPLSVILMDIDHFKSVNDTHGHTVGDTVLQQFASLLRDNVRVSDKVGRLGGEEFLIVLPEVNGKQAQAAARALRQRINAFDFYTIQRKTASFGVTQYRDDESLHTMLERVDRALYKAKENGRDRVEVL
ncbi:GGDEF domain-containing protein [Pseudomonas sp. NA-150]|uniref:GGDEF domain-containing protein n=1 Tax=Pseudomonas sp. NA-150 TaxID=3367525 RepID=UPI0037C916AE